jgi:hypothetical protein
VLTLPAAAQSGPETWTVTLTASGVAGTTPATAQTTVDEGAPTPHGGRSDHVRGAVRGSRAIGPKWSAQNRLLSPLDDQSAVSRHQRRPFTDQPTRDHD